ncbi:MAG TPA: A/G-specific adenine glycosylase [Chlamydiales bacterium]
MCKAALHTWFTETKRPLPWRDAPTPYRVWISEIMLQQTRASVVVPYFERWMTLFPDVYALSQAPLEAVIKAWEGLGYYSRARNLHASAKEIVRSWNGKLPHTKEALLALPGLGSYTTGAILSFGFHQRAAAVDGNVIRVMSRYAWIGERVDQASTKRKIETVTEEFLDEKEPWVTMEALIELGATVCTPRPRCSECPLRSECEAFCRGMPEALPLQKEKTPTVRLNRTVLVIEAKGAILVKKNEPELLMGDLWEFPYIEGKQKLKQWGGLNIARGKRMLSIKHSFTRFSATLFPWHIQASEQTFVDGFTWVKLERLKTLPFSSGHRKILEIVCESFI